MCRVHVEGFEGGGVVAEVLQAGEDVLGGAVEVCCVYYVGCWSLWLVLGLWVGA